MNSPDITFYTKLLHIEHTLATPIYLQLAQQLSNAIQRGILPQGTKLPGTRPLSKAIHLHRNTIVAVYEELALQSWVEIIPNKGTYVLKPNKHKTTATAEPTQLANQYPQQTGFSFFPSIHLASPYKKPTTTYTLNDGQPDVGLLQINQLTKWYSASLKRKSLIGKWNDRMFEPNSYFEKQLSNYLNLTRNLHLKPTNLMATRSTEMCLYIVAQLLIKPRDIVVIGNKNPFTSNMIFQQSKAQLISIPVDNEGLNIKALTTLLEQRQKIRAVYICSNRQYPTTYALSAARRIKLLQLAKQYKFAIIEDDFDYDFQYEATARTPLISADTYGNVIYLGRFGQSLLPTLQTSFMVAPSAFITEAKNYRQMIDRQGDLVLEQILSEMIHEGEIHRQIKRSLKVYKHRRDVMCSELNNTFKNKIAFQVPDGGLAVWVSFSPAISLFQFAKNAELAGIYIPETLLYQNKEYCCLRIGFGNLDEDEIPLIIQKLKASYDRSVAV
ncbi:GntR family transcriptional regulator/MocR family aminotransferase [Mesonia hippocampi]|uniref:GntR family transcriptional regulator/MocR family aminotransferase n=1 Tax=Mesonia hippocampi TaxID=1628250 RepID=A0A840EJM2_9FLAO|nr:PLP-dependent aminotransferase family protein [Mesonia hippocampi]MBB4118579.1 GntR family transcriptional regulator/MocR family aminotransferase [Mesonia hippocampi]